MICQDNQRMIDVIMRLKTNEDLAVDAINKIASVTSQPTKTTKKVGEIQELQQLLKAYIH